METPELLQFIAVTGGIASFAFGVVQYMKAQQWKAAEFVAQKMDAFFGSRANRNALLIIEWSVREIDFESDDPKEKWAKVDRETLKAALQPHTKQPEFPFPQWAIRDTFDQFYDDLERFEQYLQTDLIKLSQIKPYLRYWIRLICEENDLIDTESRMALLHYAKCYGFSDVKRLFKRFGYDVDRLLRKET